MNLPKFAFALCLSLAIPAVGADLEKAFQFLETSQQAWANWKHAQRKGGACLSCHTGVPYSFARRAAGKLDLSPAEKHLMTGVVTRLQASPPESAMTDAGAESVLNLLILSFGRKGSAEPLSKADRLALRHLWERQIPDGAMKGSWTWFAFDLEPWDSDFSNYFGAALAARALSAYPADEARLASLRGYLARHAAEQPLHNRLAWIAFAAEAAHRGTVLKELWSAQGADGGWATAALGPWKKSADAPPDSGSNAYATAWSAFTAREAGVPCSDPGLRRALDWLDHRQDPATGAWPSVSMNKVYPEGSIQRQFMTHAATGYAAAALIACGRM